MQLNWASGLRREAGRDPLPAGDRHGQVRNQISGTNTTRSKTYKKIV